MSLAVTMMDSTCVIYRPTSVTRDANQGVVQEFTVIQPVLVCSQQEAGASPRQELYKQQNAFVGTTFYFYVDPGTTENDLLVATSGYTGQVLNYLVRGTSFPVARGVLWGTDCELVQSPDQPTTVVLPSYDDVTSSTATLGGDVTGDGSLPLLAVGVVYSRTDDNDYPRIGAFGVTDVPAVSLITGAFTVSATGLSAATNYSFAPYSTNAVGTTYGNVTTFDTEA